MGTERIVDAGLQVDVSVTIFLSPTQALGFAAGTVEVAFLPEAERAFPWPDEWARQRPEFLGRGRTRSGAWKWTRAAVVAKSCCTASSATAKRRLAIACDSWNGSREWSFTRVEAAPGAGARPWPIQSRVGNAIAA